MELRLIVLGYGLRHEVSTYFQVDTSGMYRSGGFRSIGVALCEVPGEQVCDAVDWMCGDLGEHRAEVELRIEAVELGGLCRTANYAERLRIYVT